MLISQEQVRCHIHRITQCQILIYGGHTCLDCPSGSQTCVFLITYFDLALIWSQYSGQDFDQRGLTCAVITNDCKYLSLIRCYRHPSECLYMSEILMQFDCF